MRAAGGYNDVGWRSSDLYDATPEIDKLATEGMKLRGISYLGTRFDLTLADKACFRAWPAAAGACGRAPVDDDPHRAAGALQGAHARDEGATARGPG